MRTTGILQGGPGAAEGQGRPVAQKPFNPIGGKEEINVAVFPLKGVRVISLTEVWAGPFATSLLGDMGADVLHIEAIQRVAQTRGVLRPPPGTRDYPDGEPGPRP